MKKLFNALKFCLFFGLAMVLFSVTAFAYIDPSAMTYIVQVVVGFVVVGGAAFGFYFNKLKRKLKGKKDDTPKNVPVNDEEVEDNGEFDEFDAEE